MTQFITQRVRYTIDGTSPTGRLVLGDAQQAHRIVMALFPDIPAEHARARMEILYRTDHDWDTDTVRIWVQSRHQAATPPWAGDLTEPATRIAINQAIAAGDTLRFDLIANPTKAHATRDAAGQAVGRGKRIPLKKDPHRIGWLTRQANRHGFQLSDGDHGPAVTIDPLSPMLSATATEPIRIDPVRYRGTLTITDPTAFLAALHDGIGPGKAYGCGLLLAA